MHSAGLSSITLAMFSEMKAPYNIDGLKNEKRFMCLIHFGEQVFISVLIKMNEGT